MFLASWNTQKYPFEYKWEEVPDIASFAENFKIVFKNLRTKNQNQFVPVCSKKRPWSISFQTSQPSHEKLQSLKENKCFIWKMYINWSNNFPPKNLSEVFLQVISIQVAFGQSHSNRYICICRPLSQGLHLTIVTHSASTALQIAYHWDKPSSAW